LGDSRFVGDTKAQADVPAEVAVVTSDSADSAVEEPTPKLELTYEEKLAGQC
jgi:hypothetical protein